MLFRMIARAALIPFVGHSDSEKQRFGSYDSLLRRLSAYIPKKNVLSRGGELEAYWILSREWSHVDYLKQLFLGLAVVGLGLPSTRKPDQAIYPGTHSENDIYWLDVTAEGPEMTVMLDTLSATPPAHRHDVIPRA